MHSMCEYVWGVSGMWCVSGVGMWYVCMNVCGGCGDCVVCVVFVQYVSLCGIWMRCVSGMCMCGRCV